MADIISRDDHVEEHREAFHRFSKFVFFACLHIGLVLVCLALAFLGGIPLLALILGLGGTLAMIVALMVLP